jgi:hypothetical protein
MIKDAKAAGFAYPGPGIADSAILQTTCLLKRMPKI